MDDIAKRIEKYKNQRKLPPCSDYDKQYEVKKHKIFTDLYNYPDRWVEMDVWNEEKQDYDSKKKLVPLNRIGLPYQKKINAIAATFFCGVPIKYSNDLGSEDEIVDAFNKVIEKNKTEFLDRELIISNGRYTEVAELWYNIEEKNKYYGFDSPLSLRVKVLKPTEYNLYPIFDENDNLTRFSFQYSMKDEDNKKIDVFKSYTEKTIEHYTRSRGENWVSLKEIENPIKKIPIVYYQQEEVEWADVQTAIERLESIYSNTAESNDRFSFPILKIQGEVTGSLTQDKSGKVLELKGDNADAGFVEHPNAIESLTNEKVNLEQDIHDFTATPNISFDNMKGLGNILSGASAEFLFLSAHLKVKEKMSVYVPAFQRRVSIVKSFLQMMSGSLKDKELALSPIITPYVVNNDAEFFKTLMEINENQPLVSQEESMRRAGVKDPKKMIEDIKKERTSRQENENSNNFN